jgi:hypothetical protein
VTRARETQFLSFKVPLVTTTGSEVITANDNAFPTGSKLSAVGMPKSGPVSVSLNGMPIFPPQNDQGLLSWVSCEMDLCNAHVGKVRWAA